MKLFNRSKEEPAAANAPAANVAVVPTPAAAAPVAVVSAPTPTAAPESDFNAILDQSVKEMSEKVARLTSSLEGVTEERAAFEEKIQRMEERMRKLASLTEMISAPYNPFVGDAPSERASLVPQSTEPPAAKPAEPAPAPEAPAPAPAPVAVPVLVPAPPKPELADLPAVADLYPRADVVEEDMMAAPVPAAGIALLERVVPGFDSSMLLLNWANALLRATRSHQSLRELLDYYQAIGWIGPGVRAQIETYANGIATEPGAIAGDWRGNVELHERSLLFMEKLRSGGVRP